jgi:hypothetical protein
MRHRGLIGNDIGVAAVMIMMVGVTAMGVQMCCYFFLGVAGHCQSRQRLSEDHQQHQRL